MVRAAATSVPLAVSAVSLLSLLLVRTACPTSPTNPSPDAANVALRSYAYRTLDAAERLAQFLLMHVEAVTVDHGLGVAIAEGKVMDALDVLRGESNPERAALAGRLRALREDLQALRRYVVEHVLGPHAPASRLVLQPWIWRARQVRSGPPLPEPAPFGPAPPPLRSALPLLELLELASLGRPSEVESGVCLAALADCSAPQDCVDAETLGVASGYAATHRLLYQHVAQQLDCVSAHVGSTDAVGDLCQAILREAEAVALARFPVLLRDLFVEQVALCGALGVPAFFRLVWLDRILEWQRPSGCFGNFTELQEGARPFAGLRGNARLDDLLGNECVSHLTGVAVAAVAVNLNQVVQRWLQLDATSLPGV